MNELTWSYKGIDVRYTPELDGDGRSMAGLFADYLRSTWSSRLPFATVYEWCAGPGFIGFALLAEGLCRRLVLSDVNPAATAIARRTVAACGLADRVAVYNSDNLDGLPPSERFDLVVSNPPNFYCLNPLHPAYGALHADLRPNDPGWALHRAFYGAIPAFLNPGAVLCIEEVDPFAAKCFMPNAEDREAVWGPEPFDIRPRAPIFDFLAMIGAAGLLYHDTVRLPHAEMPVHLLVSVSDPEARRTQARSTPGLQFYERLGASGAGRTEVVAVDGQAVQGRIGLPEEEEWVAGLLELLASAQGTVAIADLATRLRMPAGEVLRATEQLRRLGWVV